MATSPLSFRSSCPSTAACQPEMFINPDEKAAKAVSDFNHTIWMYFFSSSLKKFAAKALIEIHQYEDLPFYITLLQHSVNPIICNLILYHYRRDRIGQSTENWASVQAGQKQVYLEIAAIHALRLMKPEDWFHQLILLYKFKSMIDHEYALSGQIGDHAAQDGWDFLWHKIAMQFPHHIEKHIIVPEIREKFLDGKRYIASHPNLFDHNSVSVR